MTIVDMGERTRGGRPVVEVVRSNGERLRALEYRIGQRTVYVRRVSDSQLRAIEREFAEVNWLPTAEKRHGKPVILGRTEDGDLIMLPASGVGTLKIGCVHANGKISVSELQTVALARVKCELLRTHRSRFRR